MPVVETRHRFEGVNASEVWNILRDIENYPQIMPNVRSVKFVDAPSGGTESEWRVRFSGNEFRWRERDDIDDDALRLSFSQIEGDLAEWKGEVRVLEAPFVEAVYKVEFDLGIPVLSALLHPLGVRAVRESCEQMMASVEHRLSTRA
jgi:coenzyme Q-binding protein COQ10